MAAAAAGLDNLCLLSLLSFRLSACESSLQRLILAAAVASLCATALSSSAASGTGDGLTGQTWRATVDEQLSVS